MARLTGAPAYAPAMPSAPLKMRRMAPRRRDLLAGLNNWASRGILLLPLYYVALTFDMMLLRDGQITSSYIDEIFLIVIGMAMLPGITRINPEVRKVLAIYSLFTLICVVAAAFNGLERYDPEYPRWLAAAVGVVLDAKTVIGVMGFACMIQHLKTDTAIRVALTIIVGIALLNVPFLLRDIVMGGNSLYGEPLRLRNFFVQPQGFYLFVVDSADLMIIAAFAAAAMYISTMRAMWMAIWLGLSFMTLIHFSVKESVAIVVCTGIIAMSIPFKNARMRTYVRVFFIGLGAVAAFPLALFVLPVISDRLTEYVGGDLGDTVRTFTYVVAVKIANDFFPFGSGAGTYASLPSRDFYFSPLYDIYGLSSMHGAARHFSGYLMDTFWPKILGEGGWFGLAVYSGMIVYIFKRAIGNLIGRTDGLNVFCLCVLTTVMIKSFAASVMTQETFVILLGFCIAYILVHPVMRRVKGRAAPSGRRMVGAR